MGYQQVRPVEQFLHLRVLLVRETFSVLPDEGAVPDLLVHRFPQMGRQVVDRPEEGVEVVVVHPDRHEDQKTPPLYSAPISSASSSHFTRKRSLNLRTNAPVPDILQTSAADSM